MTDEEHWEAIVDHLAEAVNVPPAAVVRAAPWSAVLRVSEADFVEFHIVANMLPQGLGQDFKLDLSMVLVEVSVHSGKLVEPPYRHLMLLTADPECPTKFAEFVRIWRAAQFAAYGY